jgi:hypothetical protein
VRGNLTQDNLTQDNLTQGARAIHYIIIKLISSGDLRSQGDGARNAEADHPAHTEPLDAPLARSFKSAAFGGAPRPGDALWLTAGAGVCHDVAKALRPKASTREVLHVLRLICLVRVKEGVDPAPIVEAARKMVADEPMILAGEVMEGLQLMADAGVPHASYSLVLDFEDQDSWARYIAGAPHQAFHEFSFPQVESLVVTQYQP